MTLVPMAQRPHLLRGEASQRPLPHPEVLQQAARPSRGEPPPQSDFGTEREYRLAAPFLGSEQQRQTRGALVKGDGPNIQDGHGRDREGKGRTVHFHDETVSILRTSMARGHL